MEHKDKDKNLQKSDINLVRIYNEHKDKDKNLQKSDKNLVRILFL